MPFIEVIPYEQAEGELRRIYDQLIAARGKLAAVHTILSLNPPTIMAYMDLYMKVMFGKSPLRRYQREMMAVIVSAANDCPYCVQHHAEALNFYWKDEAKVNQLIDDYRRLPMNEDDRLLCELAEKLTLDPAFEGKEKLLDKLKVMGMSDRAILDATLVIACFNFVNRIVLGLGVELEENGGKGYKY